MAPRVSVITATFNGAHLLRHSLPSLLAQDFGDFEAWIVGDASTDESEALVADLRDPRLHWVNLPRNVGSQAGPNNEGLRRAEGEWVAYLGHDDLWFPWHLSGLVAAAERSRADLVHGLLVDFDREGPCGVAGQPPEGLTYRDHFVPPSSWLHRRDAVARWGGWRDQATLGWAADYDFLRRAALARARVEFVPRLSVLKFPSRNFRAYDKASPAPQAAYLSAMRADAHALECRVLTDLAANLARHPQQYMARIRTDRDLVSRALAVSFRRHVVDPLRDVQPFTALLRQWFQRKRRRARARRGL